MQYLKLWEISNTTKSWTTWSLLGVYAEAAPPLCRFAVPEPLPTVLRGAAPHGHLLQHPLWEADTPLQRTASFLSTSPCSSSMLWLLQIIISRAKLVRWRHFKTHQKRETFWALRKTHWVPFFLETIPWPRQWCPSVNIRENLPVSLDSGMVCYLVYRMFSATHEKDGFLPNPQGVVCGSSGFMMFSGRD